MIFHDDVIQEYVHGKDITSDIYKHYPIEAPKGKPDPKRRDVVMELHTRLLPVIQKQQFFNGDICRELCPAYDEILNQVHVHLLVHAPVPYDIYHYQEQEELHLCIDLIQIADHTHIVYQMIFILLNQLSIETFAYCMRKTMPQKASSYLSYLNHEAFFKGFSHLLGWNQQINTYALQQESYEKRREQAFSMLFEAYQLQDLKQQYTVMKYLSNAAYWDEFTKTAGMFYLFDIFVEEGIEGLRKIYDLGPDNFLSAILP